MISSRFLYPVLAGLFISNVQPALALDKQNNPKLILQITVDGLRADLLERYKHNFDEGGFRYLLDEGINFKNAHYQHSNTETIVGHVSLATGAPPSVHGMVGNVWFDRKQNRMVYNVEDPNFSMLTEGAGVDQNTEIDPTQKTAKGDGRSPNTIKSTTFSDELALSTNGGSKIFSVSVKDRGAISMAGHAGKAFWFSKSNAKFVTSDYYYSDYPEWVKSWNKKEISANYSGKKWELTLPRESYTLQELSSDHKVDLAGFARNFPHPYGPKSYKYYPTMLTLSPAGDEITADFAKTLLTEENLGHREYTDYLAVSFSSNDYVVHMYGPNSLEAEDNLIRLDKTISELIKSVDANVGLDNTLIVLSADHGVPEASPVANQIGLSRSAYFGAKQKITELANLRISEEFGLNDGVLTVSQPYIYLDHKRIKEQKLPLDKVRAAVADEVSKLKGISFAVSASDIENNSLANTRALNLVKNNHFPSRSGDVYIVFEPRNYINDMDGLEIASMHGSPWRYDTHVPVIFAGFDIQPKTVYEPVTPYDVAPTLSGVLGITQPSGSIGNILPLKANP